MRAVEQSPRNKKQKERRAKPARRPFAFHSPRPQLLKGPTKESMSSKPKPSDGDFVAATRGSVADAFFGASPVVASALGIRSGATPRGRIYSKPHPPALPRKEDISTLLGIGHFYFALARWGPGLRACTAANKSPTVITLLSSLRGEGRFWGRAQGVPPGPRSGGRRGSGAVCLTNSSGTAGGDGDQFLDLLPRHFGIRLLQDLKRA